MIQIAANAAIDGTSLVNLEGIAPPIAIAVHPGSGTVLVEYSLTPGAYGNPGSARWFPWPAGAVSTATEDGRTLPTAALRITGQGHYEVRA